MEDNNVELRELMSGENPSSPHSDSEQMEELDDQKSDASKEMETVVISPDPDNISDTQREQFYAFLADFLGQFGSKANEAALIGEFATKFTQTVVHNEAGVGASADLDLAKQILENEFGSVEKLVRSSTVTCPAGHVAIGVLGNAKPEAQATQCGVCDKHLGMGDDSGYRCFTCHWLCCESCASLISEHGGDIHGDPVTKILRRMQKNEVGDTDDTLLNDIVYEYNIHPTVARSLSNDDEFNRLFDGYIRTVMNRSVAKRVVRLRKVYGVQLYLSWWFPIIILFLAVVLYFTTRAVDIAFALSTVLTVILLCSTTLHEVVYCYVAKRLGYQPEWIRLHPLGGDSFCGVSKTPVDVIKTCLAGPLVHIPLALIFFFIWQYGDLQYVQAPADEHVDTLKENFWFAVVLLSLFLQIILFGVNLLVPIYPSEGGQILASLLVQCCTAETSAVVICAVSVILILVQGAVVLYIYSHNGLQAILIGIVAILVASEIVVVVWQSAFMVKMVKKGMIRLHPLFRHGKMPSRDRIYNGSETELGVI